MPIYEYKCRECGSDFEELVSLNAKLPACPRCHSDNVEKKMSGFSVHGGGGGSGGDSCPTCSTGTCGL